MKTNKITRRAILGRIVRFAAPYKFSLIFSFLLGLLSVSLSLFIPVLIGRAVDMMTGPGAVDYDGIVPILYAIAACAIGSALFQWLMTAANNRITYNVTRDMRRTAFRTLQSVPVSFYDGVAHGGLVSRVISDVETVSDGVLLGTSHLFCGVVTVAATLVFMIRLQPVVAAAVAILTPLSLFVSRFVASRTYGYFKEQAEVREEESAFSEEIISSQKVVKAFGKEEDVKRIFREINARYEKKTVRAVFFSSLVNPSTRLVNSVVYAAVALIGALFAVSGGITVGALSSFLSYASQYTKPFNEISGVVSELQGALACAGRVFEVIDAERESPRSEGERIGSVRGDVELCHIDFSYRKDRPLLRDVTLSVRAGSHVAVVGPTGCGKTTLINLLMRYYDPASGRITLDGVDVSTVAREDVRRNFGMVLQDTWIRSATVRENIALGKPDATDDEIERAARAVRAHSFITKLPDGYDTVLSENGGSLSAGQRQLISVARVMLTAPPMLILDEATSSIDTRTEIEISKSFERLMEGKTAFIVAHRLSTVRDADLIVVMRDGEIAERGTHEELLSENGFYKKLYDSQWRGAEIGEG
ncbi:MAG: ABC transporter ATP-binding protein [Clostridia bacterium]|nr:ABC transporter ATP-binding protein [Clostridia bacterium]